jgi:lactoylglutathione lyase
MRVTCQRLADADAVIHRPLHERRMAFGPSPDGISVYLLQRCGAVTPREPWASAPNFGTW